MNKQIILIATLLFFSTSYCQLGKFYPVDETYKDTSLILFRSDLLDAAISNDTSFIFRHLDTKIFNGFGGDGGIQEFFEVYWPDTSEDGLRPALIRALKLGGTLHGNVYRIPYATEHSQVQCSLECGIVIAPNINVREEPNPLSNSLTQLSYDVVNVVDWTPEESVLDHSKWINIKLLGGKSGWIPEIYLYSPIGYRFTFEKIDGRWIWTRWAAGD